MSNETKEDLYKSYFSWEDDNLKREMRSLVNQASNLVGWDTNTNPSVIEELQDLNDRMTAVISVAARRGIYL